MKIFFAIHMYHFRFLHTIRVEKFNLNMDYCMGKAELLHENMIFLKIVMKFAILLLILPTETINK